jgi:hypothetical protein
MRIGVVRGREFLLARRARPGRCWKVRSKQVRRFDGDLSLFAVTFKHCLRVGKHWISAAWWSTGRRIPVSATGKIDAHQLADALVRRLDVRSSRVARDHFYPVV